MNVFLPVDRADDLLGALPSEVIRSAESRRQLQRDGQARLWCDRTPIDIFLATTPFDDDVSGRICFEMFGDVELPFLACRELAVFKAFFDWTKDWAGVEEMHAAGTLDSEAVAGVLVRCLGGADHRIERLRNLSLR